MTLRRSIITALDRRGTRRMLAWIGTRYARYATGEDVEILYDDIWMHRIGQSYLADSSTFLCYEGNMPVKGESRIRRERMIDYWLYRHQLRPGDVVVDVGAGVGTEVLEFSRMVGPNGRVFAIEAHPGTYLGLLKTCRWNQLTNVVCIQAACMDKPGAVYIEDVANHETNSIGRGNIEVPGDTLDNLLSQHGCFGRIALLKMNIEGAEVYALPGAEAALQRTGRLVIASHDFRAKCGEGQHFATKTFILRFLEDRGFTVETRDNHPSPAVQDYVYGSRGA